MKKFKMISGRRSNKAGQPPGTLEYLAEDKVEDVKIQYIDYDKEEYIEKEVDQIKECFELKDKDSVSWINIDGLSDLDTIKQIGKNFDIHLLALEDILHVHQRPKLEEYDNSLFIVLKMLNYNETSREIDSEQLSIIVGKNYVITFQEKPGDLFDPIRERLKNKKGKIRAMNADYLAYCLVDLIVDNYFIILEKISDRIEIIEEELINEPSEKTLQSIYELKNEMIFLRKSVWPLREVVNRLEKNEIDFIDRSVKVYFRDLYDHTIQVIETVETLRDMLSGMLDIYLSSLSNKMNEVMKVLTIIATIFIPLTFIAGIYGMNFQYMPELNLSNGYFIVLGIMLVVALYMVYFFKKKDWL